MKHKIIHMVVIKTGDKLNYICNWAVGVSLDKVTMEWKKVTCKNCLKIKKVKGK